MTNSSGNPVAAEWQLVPGSSNATTKMLILPITSSGVTEEYTATGIAVSGSDVYVVGYGDYSGTQYTALYWVNGTLETLSANGGEFQATSIAVSGSDVYVAGTEGPPGYESPVYWVNGTVKGLSTPSGTVDPEATGIAVSGSDVYVSGEWGVLCGSGLTEGYCQTPGYWVNGTLKTLPLPSGWTNAVPTGIAASGSDVYLAGYEAGGDAAAYWVNGTLQTLPLPSGASWTIITGIAVSGSDVYVVGYGGDNTTGDQTAMFWVNGTLETLPLPSGMTGAEATGIAVSGSDVYVAGCAILGGFQPCSQAAYWVNGKPETLPLSSNMTGAEATGIAVSTQ
jgi:uncharacterized membrane protein